MSEKTKSITVEVNADTSGISAAIDGVLEKVRELNEEPEKTVDLLERVSPRSAEEEKLIFLKAMGWL